MELKIQKTKKAFKLFRVNKKNEIKSLFIDNKKSLPINEWIKAEDNKTKGFSHRPGWHTSPQPFAPHLKTNGRKWFHVEICDFVKLNRPINQGGVWYLSNWIKIIQPVKDEY